MSHSSSFLNQTASGGNIAQSANDGGSLPLVETNREGSRIDRLLTADDVAERLQVSKDWVWDHSSRKAPYLPVIRLGDGALRYRASKIEEFISERERLSMLKRGRR